MVAVSALPRQALAVPVGTDGTQDLRKQKKKLALGD